MGRFFCYFRVSAGGKNRQGLYLEAQQMSVNRLLDDRDAQVVGEVFELEKATVRDRPALDAAIEQCQKKNAVLLIAKVGTLIFNPDFLTRLTGSGVDVRACDCPALVTGNLEALLEAAIFRRKQIGGRIRLGLQAARSRGKTIGSPANLDPESAQKGRVRGALSRKSAADRFSRRFYGQITDLLASGLSMNAVARHFNRMKVPTATGRTGSWSCATVRNILTRGESLGLESSGRVKENRLA